MTILLRRPLMRTSYCDFLRWMLWPLVAHVGPAKEVTLRRLPISWERRNDGHVVQAGRTQILALIIGRNRPLRKRQFANAKRGDSVAMHSVRRAYRRRMRRIAQRTYQRTILKLRAGISSPQKTFTPRTILCPRMRSQFPQVPQWRIFPRPRPGKFRVKSYREAPIQNPRSAWHPARL